MPEPIVTKRCSDCKQIKSLSEFHKNKTKKDGHKCYCKICGKNTYNPITQSRYDKKRRLRFPHKLRAKEAVKYAVKIGKLPRAYSLMCSCGKTAHDYHHESYEPKHRLNVIAVCQSCHQNIHKL